MVSTATKRSLVYWFPNARIFRIIQCARFAWGFSTVPFADTFQLTRYGAKVVAPRTICRRTAQMIDNSLCTLQVEANQEQTDVIADSLPTSCALPKCVSGRIDDRQASPSAECTRSPYAVALPLPSLSRDSANRLDDSYDLLASQWTQMVTETRQFYAQIAKLQSSLVGPDPNPF
uniref:Uncharacterized protein n=1 Tax=Peronospora matthiolae TaxID=2874970 RepID=A0AAV1T5I2_9STRA